MATGILGQSNPAATTNTTVYTVPSGKVSTLTVSICNTSVTPISVRLAVAASGTPSISEYLEYDATIPQNGVLERGGIVAQAAKNIVVYANTAAVSVTIFGYEE